MSDNNKNNSKDNETNKTITSRATRNKREAANNKQN